LPSDLSPPAARLLDVLRRYARRRESAITDERLRKMLGVSKREVIKLADELLRAKILVLAETSPPMGRWLAGDDPADLPLANCHANNLDKRARKIHVRAKLVRLAIEATSQRLRSDGTGQAWLFPPPIPFVTGLSVAAPQPPQSPPTPLDLVDPQAEQLCHAGGAHR